MDSGLQWILVVVAAALVIWMLSKHVGVKRGIPNKGQLKEVGPMAVDGTLKQAQPGLDPYNGGDPVFQGTMGMESRNPIGNCTAPEAQWLSSSLLPQNDPNMTNDVNLFDSSQISNQNFLEAGWQVGRDTISNSLKNANYSLRSDPPIPKDNDFTWIQKSSIGPDTNRRPLDIGSSL